MSILSSTKSGRYSLSMTDIVLQRGYSRSNGFFCRDGGERYLNFIQSTEENGETVFFAYIWFMYYRGYMYIRSAKALDDLEQFWDETDKDKKEALVKHLFDNYKV